MLFELSTSGEPGFERGLEAIFEVSPARALRVRVEGLARADLLAVLLLELLLSMGSTMKRLEGLVLVAEQRELVGALVGAAIVGVLFEMTAARGKRDG